MEDEKSEFSNAYGYLEQIEKGESVTGFLARHRLANNEPVRRICFSWLIPTELRRVSESLREFVGSQDELLDGHTLYPLFSRFLNEDDREIIRGHLLEKFVPYAAAKIGVGGPRRDWNKDLLAWCSECLKCDVTIGGKPFWRRDHFVPGVLFCGKHGKPLEVHCVSCNARRRKFIAPLQPGRTCECEQSFMTDGLNLSPLQVENEVEIAQATSYLLDSKNLPNFSYGNICSVFYAEAMKQGVFSGKLINWDVLMELLSVERIFGSAARTNFLNLDRRVIVQAIRGEATLRHPIHNIILLQALVGRWAEIKRIFETASFENRDSRYREDVKIKCGKIQRIENEEHRAELVEKFRHVYLKLRDDYPRLSHTQVLTMLPAVAGRVMRVGHGNEESNIWRKNKNVELDDEVVLHISERLMNLRISGYIGKLSAAVLLSGHRLVGTFSRVRKRLPRADAMMSTLVGLRLTVEHAKEGR